MGGGESGGGGGSSGVDPSLEFIKAENAKKDALRAKVNRLYGIDDPSVAVPRGAAPDRAAFTTGSKELSGRPIMMVDDGGQYIGGYEYDKPGGGTESDWRATRPGSPESFDQAGYDAALAKYNASPEVAVDEMAAGARSKMADEERQLADSTRSYYEDDLTRAYKRAMRENRFNLADTGNLGGSQQTFTEGELGLDQGKGATRITDQVTSALNNLRNQREQERLSATNLVNAGAGEDAVNSASAGVTRAFQNAQGQQKADITSDLFSAGASGVAANNAALQQQALAQLYRGRIASFFPNSGTGGGARVSPT